MRPDSPMLPLDEKRAFLAEILKQQMSQARQTPLARGEERIWRVLQLEPNSAVYNLGFAYELKGPLDVDALEKALHTLTHRHDALRTSYVVIQGVPTRVIRPEVEVRFVRVDLSSISEADFSLESHRLAIEASRSQFDLAQAPLWRFTLLERSKSDKVFLINTHHIISDRWSVGILVHELALEYTALVHGEPLSAPSESRSYSEVMRRIEASISEQELAAHLDYWRAQFDGDVHDLILPTERQRVGETSYGGMRRTFMLPEGLATRLGTLAASERVTTYVVLIAALAARLHLDTGQTDLVFVTPVSGRHHALTRGVIGYFNNLVPIRLTISDAFCFRDLLRSSASVVKGAFEHQDVPFQQIAEQPGLNRIRLGRCTISVQNTAPLALDLPGIASSYYDVPTDSANFDLAVFFEEQAGAYRGWVDAKTDLWTRDAIDQFIERFLALLEALADQPERPFAEFSAGPHASGPASGRGSNWSTTQTTPNEPAVSGPAARSQNEMERQMIAIWEDVIGLRPLGPDSHFFALSGDSLLAARLFDRIARAIGRELPLAAILQAPTIRQLSDLILKGGDVPWWAALVPLQPLGTRQPLFCVHGGGGGVLTYTRVAEHLGPDQPLWGLQAPRRDEQPLPLRIEHIAEQYIQSILSVRPEGPYSLCGHSFGGLVAFEMARQLIDQGKRVSLLVVIDHPGPDAQITWIDKLRWYGHSLSQLNTRQKVHYIVDRVNWRIRSSPRIPQVLRTAAAKRAGHKKGSKAVAEHRLKTLNETMTAMALYRPGPYPGRVTLFRARSGSPAINTDPLGGWGLVAQGGVEVHDFGCDHMELFNEPHCRSLCTAFRDCLDRAQQFGEATPTAEPAQLRTASSR
jgi:thioesterase domain-containing protein